jgi:hypothetical protein
MVSPTMNLHTPAVFKRESFMSPRQDVASWVHGDNFNRRIRLLDDVDTRDVFRPCGVSRESVK